MESYDDETKKAQKEYDNLTKKIEKANQATKSFAKKGIRGVIGGFKNLIGAFGVVGGVYMFANMAKNVFELTKGNIFLEPHLLFESLLF